MKVDISISFNDLTPHGEGELGHSLKPLDYYTQLLFLLKSVKLNWKKEKLDYSIYVHYSREFDSKKKKELRSLGCNLIYDPFEHNLPFHNRPNVYKHQTDGDYTLCLDTDILVLSTPSLLFEKEMYMAPAGRSVLKEEEWKKLYSEIGIQYIAESTDYLNEYRAGKKINCHHFNNGCTLIKNSIKKDFHELILSDLNQRMKDKILIFSSKYKVFAGQIMYGLLMKKFNWGYLDPRINYNPSVGKKIPSNEIQLLHYAGAKGYSPEIKKIMFEINGKWSLQNN